MSLKAKLTMGSVLLATLIVMLISAVDLGSLAQFQFASTLERAELIKLSATEAVKDTLNRPRPPSLDEALRDPSLTDTWLKLIGQSKTISEIAVISEPPPEDVLASTVAAHIGSRAHANPDFARFVARAGLWEKLRVLTNRDTVYFQLDEDLGSGGVVYFKLRLIIDPTFLRNDLGPSLAQNVRIAIFSVGGAVLLTVLFSAVAFRKLGRIGRMLDLVARGEFDPEIAKEIPGKPASDELSIIASKVSLLGQRLRGAQFEVSDLRGNIDRLLLDLEDAVLLFNRERRLVSASGSVNLFLGRDRAALHGEPVGDVFPPDTPVGMLVAEASETGHPLRNRRIPWFAAGSGAPAVVLLSVDIVESLPGGSPAASGFLVRLRDPEAQRKLGRELQTADRLAAISKVTSGVAHEVKNPLNAILLHVEVAKAKLAKGDTDVGQQMQIISSEILRLDRVVRTFLDFTRPVELNLTAVPLGGFVGEIADLARPQAAAANIRVEVRHETSGVEVRVDRDLLKQALLNIVVNAIEAMPTGGALTIGAGVGGEMAEIRVADTGRGIPPELREKIFRLYFTTKQGGSGIGLAMTFRIVQLHDGTIDFTSEPGKGTTFLIRLPIAV